ncbi:hypothetical protein ACJX0J_016883, partial [Zea mays]
YFKKKKHYYYISEIIAGIRSVDILLKHPLYIFAFSCHFYIIGLASLVAFYIVGIGNFFLKTAVTGEHTFVFLSLLILL